MTDRPLVTCVMITGKSPERRRLANLAAESFRRQTYGPRELLVINDSGKPWITGDLSKINEVIVERRDDQTLGDLRNLAFDLAAGELLCQWDDDDWHGRRRLQTQVEAWQADGRANVLRRELFVDLRSLKTGEPRVIDAGNWRAGGFAGTILHPRSVAARYPAAAKGEDLEFVAAIKQECGVTSIDNDSRDYVRLFNGHNTWPAEHFRVMCRDSRSPHAWETREVNCVRWMIWNWRVDQMPCYAVSQVHHRLENLPWMNPGSASYISELIQREQLRDVLEIGHLHGVSTCYLAAAVAWIDGNVTSVDVPASGSYAPAVEDTLAACCLRADIRRHPRGSLGALPELLQAGRRYDLILIDGNHTFPAVAADFFYSTLLLRPGGWLVFDDADNALYPDVAAAIQSLVRTDPRFVRHVARKNWHLCQLAV